MNKEETTLEPCSTIYQLVCYLLAYLASYGHFQDLTEVVLSLILN